MPDFSIKDRISAFVALGEYIDQLLTEASLKGTFQEIQKQTEKNNAWFTESSIKRSLSETSNLLKSDKLYDWLSAYSISEQQTSPLTIGVVMAGNIPLVGFHDFLSVLISENKLAARVSSKDNILIKHLSEALKNIEPRFLDQISFHDNLPPNIEAVIATGSNNSARYFEHYYGELPHIFRKNRNSVAILESEISDDEIVKLGTDVFYYFGLGCRNVSKLYIPPNFDLLRLNQQWTVFNDVLETNPYKANYRYQRALMRTDNIKHLDLGNILLVEDSAFSSPVSVLNFEYYNSLEEVNSMLKLNLDNIQVIMGSGHYDFGSSQSPALNDYADDVDTLAFLLSL